MVWMKCFNSTLLRTFYQPALKSGIRNSKRFCIVPGASELCIVVRDAANGSLGSLSVPISKYVNFTAKAGQPR